MAEELRPDPEPTTMTKPGPACALCGATANLVHWQRRLTPEELGEHHALETVWHTEQAANVAQAAAHQAALVRQAVAHGVPRELLPAEQPAQPRPLTLTPHDDLTRAVHGCHLHAITQDASARVHQAECTAPDAEQLPNCGCNPEPLPLPDEMPAPQLLPEGWT